MAKHNWINANQRSEQAEAWIKKMDRLYKNDTKDSVADSYVYPSNTFEFSTSARKELKNNIYNTEIIIDNIDSVGAIFKYNIKDNITCVLNFASYKNPGGGFIRGAMAQEEALCHESNLYNILTNFYDDFYIPNLKRLNRGLYNNNLIYSPDVLFIRDKSIICCDVITCAAPNKKVAQEYQKLPNNIINHAMKNRCDHILHAAYDSYVDTLILGAFGCGVFKNNPYDVASIFKELLETKYKGVFKKVIFAIPKGSRDSNYKAFEEVFKGGNK